MNINKVSERDILASKILNDWYVAGAGSGKNALSWKGACRLEPKCCISYLKHFQA